MTEIFDDIRGIYDFCVPCEALQPFVEFFSESSREKTALLAGGTSFTVEMFPSWTPTFWINLGVPYRLSSTDGSQIVGCDNDILVLRDSLMARHNQAADHIFTVKFYPGGLEAIMGISQTKLIGRVVPLAEGLPPVLLRDLHSAESFQRRVSIAERFFMINLRSRPGNDHYYRLVRDSIGVYAESGMLPNTGQLAEKVFVHSKTINRYFTRVIGLTPKKYFSIIRARSALTAYFTDRAAFSPEAFGYYDHSHFYKAARQFTGRPLAAGS